MTEHYTKRTESVLTWCDVCRQLTTHSVSCGRRGRCTEHAPKEKPPKKPRRQLELFGGQQ